MSKLRAASVLALSVLALTVLAITGCAPFGGVPGGGPGSGAAGAGASGTPAPSEASLTAPADATPLTVDYVFDGDTLALVDANGERDRVRLIGLDTPEVTEPVECYGPEATARLRELLPAGTAVLTSADKDTYDKYGRELRYVWTTDGTFVNLQLVAEGFGSALSIRPNTLHKAAFARAEAQARDAGLGLWAACPAT
jgi:micrococcal nuclease